MRFLAGLLFVLSPLYCIAQDWGKYINKIDDYYRDGNYEKAGRTNEKFGQKVEKKIGKETHFYIIYKTREARDFLSNKQLWQFVSSISEAETLNTKVNADNDYNYISDALDICELYIDYGNFKKSEEYLTEIAKRLPKISSDKSEFERRLVLYQAQTLLGQGYYAKSLSYILANEEYYKRRAVEREAYEDPKTGVLKSRELGKDEMFKGFQDYAIIKQMTAKALWLQGDYLAADEAFGKTLEWIDRQPPLGSSSGVYLETSYMYWLMSKQYGLDDKELRRTGEKLLNKCRSNLFKNHYLIMDISFALLKLYLETNYESYDFKLTAYKELVINDNPTTSAYRVNLEILDIYKNKSLYSNDEMQDRIANVSKNIPDHGMKTELLEFGYNQSIFRKNYKGIGLFSQEIVAVDKVLYGASAPRYHISLINYANYLLDYGNNFAKVDSIYQQSFYKIVQPEVKIGHKDYLNTLNHLGKYYESMDQFTEATGILDEAKKTVRQIYDQNDYEYGIELNKISSLQIKIGEYASAEKSATQAIEILEVLKNDETKGVYFAESLQNQAKLWTIYGEYDNADAILKTSEKIIKNAYDLQGYDDLQGKIDIAEIKIRLGQYEKTQELLEETLTTYKEIYGAKSRHLINPLVSLGEFQLAVGEYAEAEKNARRALDIAISSTGELSSKTGLALDLLSNYYLLIGDYDKAMDPATRVAEIYLQKFGENHINYAASLSKIGLLKFYRGESFEPIDTLYSSALSIIEEQLGNQSPLYAEVLSKYALLDIRETDYHTAFSKINKAYAIWTNRLGSRNNLNKANIYSLAGDVYYRMLDYEKAKEFYTTSSKIFESLFNESHPKYIELVYKLSKVYYMQKDYRRARKNMDFVIEQYNSFIDIYFPSLSEREKAKFWNSIKSAYEFYNTLALNFVAQSPRIKTSMLDNALKTKALLLNTSLKTRERILSSNDQMLIEKFNLWQENKETLTSSLSMSKDQLAESEISVDQLKQTVESLEKEISERSNLFNDVVDSKGISWKDIKNELGQNEVAIEMIRFRLFDQVFTDSIIYAVLYYKNRKSFTEPELILLKNGKDLENKFYKSYRNSIIFKVKDRFSYDNYWKPIIGKIGSTSKMYISSDGVYNQINLEAIPLDDGRYVLDNSNIVLISNTKDLLSYKLNTDEKQIVNEAIMIGNPNYYVTSSRPNIGYIDQLPGTELEVTNLNKVLKTNGWETETYLNADATEALIKDTSNPKVFHIATHGFFNNERASNDEMFQTSSEIFENPLLRTGLMLSGAGDIINKTSFNFNIEDGILTAYEAMNLSFDETDLVVLSACETGLGDVTAGEGVYGLQRAFIVAGANTLIMSMFKVDDTATQKLMVSFYQKWITTGNKRQSFIDAKKEIRNEFKDPIYWGAFIMIGLD